MTCPDPERIAEYVAGALEADARRGVELHADACADCRVAISTLADAAADDALAGTDGPAATAGVTARIEPGGQLGRYVVLHRIGAGATGAVFLAYDPELDRNIALKLLHRDPSSDGPGRHLRSEGRALARLSHPNVVSVFDVGEVDGRTFIAMEYIRGQTLRQWLATAARPWRDVVRVLVDAGRGLAAAHAAGLVHRDVKPDNVLVGADDRVLVADLGLARSPRVAAPDRDDGAAELAVEPPTSLTRSGAVVGTPVYLAPEQLRGEPADARSDQFSFCVALYEAVYGTRPFTATTVAGLASAIATGSLAPPAHPVRIPRWLRRIVVRGLAADAGARFASMDALLRAIAAGLRRRPRRAALAATITAAVAATVLVAAARGRDDARCRGADAKLAGIWDPTRRIRVGAAFAATRLAHAPGTLAQIEAGLDRYTGAWKAMYTDACLATHERGEQSPALLDHRMQCLEHRRRGVLAAVDVLAGADARTVDRAMVLVNELEPIAPCADPAYVTATLPLPAAPEARAVVEAMQDELAQVQALARAGADERAAARARTALAAGAGVDYPPVRGALLLALGTALTQAEPAEAETTLFAAIDEAARAGDPALEAAAWIQLVYVVGVAELRVDDARTWLRTASVAVLRAADDPRLRGRLLAHAALLDMKSSRAPQAETAYQRAIVLLEALSPAPAELGTALDGLAALYLGRGDNASAVRVSRRSLAHWTAYLGPDHPDLIRILIRLAVALGRSGERDEARAHATHALELARRVYGPRHRALIEPLSALGSGAQLDGRLAEARRLYEEAVAIADDGADAGLGGAMSALTSHFNLAELLAAHGDRAVARIHYDRALALAARFPGRGAMIAAQPLIGSGRLYLDAGDRTRARVELERACPMTASLDPVTLQAECEFLLARAIWSGGAPDRARARTLARHARELYADDPTTARETAEVDNWLKPRGDGTTANKTRTSGDHAPS